MGPRWAQQDHNDHITKVPHLMNTVNLTQWWRDIAVNLGTTKQGGVWWPNAIDCHFFLLNQMQDIYVPWKPC